LLSQFKPRYGNLQHPVFARAQLDLTVVGFADHAKWAASESFVLVNDVPRKPWISQRTWGVIRMGSQCRNLLRNWKMTAAKALYACILRCWHGVCKHAVNGNTSACAAAWYHVHAQRASMAIAQTMHSLDKLVRIRRPLLLFDRRAALLVAADAAQRAAENNDSRKLYSIVKSLAGRETAPLRGIKHEDGSMINDAAETTARWRRHFAALFRADVVNDPSSKVGSSGTPASDRAFVANQFPFTPSVEQVHKALFLLNGDKGLGPDSLSASILQAGGWTTAKLVHEIITQVIALEYVPIAWRGGKLVVLYKGKGSPSD
jgi:hypothetical protein